MKPIFTSVQDAEIAEEYRGGESLPVIAKRWGVCIDRIWQSLIRTGVPRRKCRERQCTLNEAAFDDIETNPVAAYFAGLLYADGCVHERDRGETAISIGLSGDDGFLVRAFREFVGSSHQLNISCRPSGFSEDNCLPSTRLSFRSDRLVSQLAKYGVVPRKSLREVPPPSMLTNRDWWRGVIDGDGWVTIDKRPRPIIGVVGSAATCEAFLSFVRTIVPTDEHVYRNPSCWGAKVTGRKAARVTIALYRNRAPSLPRKHAIADEVMAFGKARWGIE